MKKLLSLLLCLCMVFALCACAQLDAIRNTELPPLPTPDPPAAPAPSAAPASEPAPAPETPAPTQAASEPEPTASAVSIAAEPGERVIIYYAKTQEIFDAPDGTEMLVFSYVTPKVRIDENAQAAEEINEQLRLLDELYISGSEDHIGKNQLLENALDNFSYVHDTGAALNTLFTSARTVKNTRADGSVISFRYWTSVYTGNANGSYGYDCYNYSAESGEKLSLDSLSADPAALKMTLADELVKLAKESGLYAQLSGNDMDPDSALAAVVREGIWCFSGEGIDFYPAFGELRPESEGAPVLTVPYTALAGVLDARFLPPVRSGSAALEVLRLTDVEDGTVQSIDRIVLSEGEELYLKINGTAYDVSVSSFYVAAETEGENRFVESDRHWYASCMSDCALQLCASVPNGMPNLMIRYTDADYVQHCLFLSQSGADGGVTLVDDSIQAIG